MPRLRYAVAMAMAMAEHLRREALALPSPDRATLAAELLASLDEDLHEDTDLVRSAWLEEIDRRAEAVVAGEAETEPWEAVRQRIADELAK